MTKKLLIAVLCCSIFFLGLGCYFNQQTISLQRKLLDECREANESHTAQSASESVSALTSRPVMTMTVATTAITSGSVGATAPLLMASDPRPKEPKYADALREAAARMGLYWQVSCTSYLESEDSQWLAFAQQPGEHGYYVEEGARPHWIVSGRSREDAAIKLLRALQDPPNYRPPRRGPEKPKRPCDGENLIGGSDH